MINTSVSLKEAANLVAVIGRDTTCVFSGEMGIGKSAMLPIIAERLGLTPVYVDCALLDLGDLQLPAADLEAAVMRFLPNELWVTDGPVVLMLDEIGKAMRPVQNALLPLLYERRIGKYKLPEGSVVFGTTNLATDGVGDNVQAHARNRVCWVNIKKPNADEWTEWAMDNSVAPEVIAWVKDYPHCLASYTDGEHVNDNPYIFNPKRQQAAFVSPRSLAKAGHIVANRIHMSQNALIASLSGTIGEAAARDMQAYSQLADALPEWRRIIEKPEDTPVPESAIAQTILALGAVARLDEKNIGQWLVYMKRLALEVQAMFVMQIMRSGKRNLVVTHKDFSAWCLRHEWLY